MEDDLAAFLQSAGVTSSTLSVLEKEFITSKGIFFSLNKDHFTKLLSYEGIKVGQHALLMKLNEANSVS